MSLFHCFCIPSSGKCTVYMPEKVSSGLHPNYNTPFYLQDARGRKECFGYTCTRGVYWRGTNYLPDLSQISCAHFSNNWNAACRRARGTRSLSSLNCTAKWVRFLHTVKDEQYLLASLVYSAQRYSLLLSKLPFDVLLFLCSVVDLDPHWFLSPWSGSGTRGAKMVKWRKFMFWFEVLYIFLWGLRGFSLELERPSWRSTEK